jgi:2'-5' RNA ligase
MDQQRLFVAIELPTEVKTALTGLKIPAAGCKPVAAAQLHLTLRFIGPADAAALTAIKAALATVSGEPFPLALQEIGLFPATGRPRILWAGTAPSPELRLLQQRVELAVQSAGIPAEERRFSPHITIARLKEAAPAAIQAFTHNHRGFSVQPFTVDSFNLYASRLSTAGAEHTVLQNYPLQGS